MEMVNVDREEKLSNIYGRRLMDSCLEDNKITKSLEFVGSLLILQLSSNFNDI